MSTNLFDELAHMLAWAVRIWAQSVDRAGEQNFTMAVQFMRIVVNQYLNFSAWE